jgi:hypothetical protein
MTSQIEGTSDETSSASEDLPGSATTASNLLCAVAPTNPTSIPDIIAALRGIDALHGLADHEYHWLASHGSERVAEDRVIVFRGGEPAHHLNIILKGKSSPPPQFRLNQPVHRPHRSDHREAPVLPDDVLGRRGVQLRFPLDTRFPRERIPRNASRNSFPRSALCVDLARSSPRLHPCRLAGGEAHLIGKASRQPFP